MGWVIISSCDIGTQTKQVDGAELRFGTGIRNISMF